MKGSPREEAFRFLYENELRRDGPPSTLRGRAERITQGVLESLDLLDSAISATSDNWRIERMAPVDRTIIRIGLYELRHEPNTPLGVILNEAVELAKKYSTEQSGAFVNGVLAALAKRERPDEAVDDSSVAEAAADK